MRIWLLTIFLFSVCGCASPFNSVKEERHIQENSKEIAKTALTGSSEISYPAPTSMVVTASGNAKIEMCPATQEGLVTAKRAETKSSDEKRDAKFSFDALYESTPQWVIPCILFFIIVLLVVLWWWIKTTSIGRASDSFIAGRIKSLDQAIETMSETLIRMDSTNPACDTIKNKLDLLKDLRSKQLEKKRP